MRVCMADLLAFLTGSQLGNLHINITAKSYDPKVEAIIEPYIYEEVAKYK